MNTLVVRGIGELCTCDPDRGAAPGVIEGGALVSQNGTLSFVGPEHELESSDLPDDAVEIDARGCAVVPGFVDSHTHIVWLGDRGDEFAQRSAGRTYEEIAAAGGGIELVARHSPAALAACLRRLLADREARLALGTAARATVEREFTWRACGERTLAAYHEALR